jgi:hypothetical protein
LPTELLIYDSQQSDRHNLCSVVTCDLTYGGEWFMFISFVVLLGGMGYDIHADQKVQ